MKELVIFIALLLHQIPMKQLGLLIAIFFLGSLGSLYHPFWAILLYYLLAVLRPQFLWKWALPVEWRWSLFAAVIVFISLIANAPRVLSRIRLNCIAVLMILYGTWLMFSMLNAFDPLRAQLFGQDIGKILIMAIITSLVVDSLWQVRALTRMMFIALGYVAWEINTLYLSEGRIDIFHYGYGGLDNNGAGLLLAMGLPFAFTYATGSTKMWQRVVCGGVGLLMLHAVLMTYSRGAMVASTVGIAWLLIHHRPRVQSFLIVTVLAVALPFMAGQEIRERFQSTANYRTDGSGQSRLESWSAAWKIAWDHPLVGTGIRNSNRYSQNYGADRHNRTIHSQYLQIAADSGLPAMTLFCAILGTSLALLTRCRNMCRDQLESSEADPERKGKTEQLMGLVNASQASLVIYAVGGVFLSLEMFELPWLIMVTAGVMPYALQREFEPGRSEVEVAAQHYPHLDQLKRMRSAAPAIVRSNRGVLGT